MHENKTAQVPEDVLSAPARSLLEKTTDREKDGPVSLVLRELEALGFRIGQATLRNYWKAGLCPGPSFQGGGRGVEALFPPSTSCEVYAIHRIIKEYRATKRISMHVVRLASFALENAEVFVEAIRDECWMLDLKNKTHRWFWANVQDHDHEAFLAMKWLVYFFDAAETTPGLEIRRKDFRDREARTRAITRVMTALVAKAITDPCPQFVAARLLVDMVSEKEEIESQELGLGQPQCSKGRDESRG